LRFLGLPTFNLEWSEISVIEHARGVFPFPNNDGVCFQVKGKRLIFWCGSPSEAEVIINELAQYVPQKIADREKLRWIVP